MRVNPTNDNVSTGVASGGGGGGGHKGAMGSLLIGELKKGKGFT